MFKICSNILLITQYHTIKSHKTKVNIFSFYLSFYVGLHSGWLEVSNQRAEQPLALVVVGSSRTSSGIPVWPGITFLLDDSAGNYLHPVPTFNAESNVPFSSVMNHAEHVEGVTIRVVDGHVTCVTRWFMSWSQTNNSYYLITTTILY